MILHVLFSIICFLYCITWTVQYQAIVQHMRNCVSLSFPAGLAISYQLSVPSPLSDRITSFTSFTRLQLTEQGIHIIAVQTNRASVGNYKLASVSATHASILKTEVASSSSRMSKLLWARVITDTPEWNSNEIAVEEQHNSHEASANGWPC